MGDIFERRMQAVFRDVFDDDSLVLRRDLTASDVEIGTHCDTST
jgi:hypothetical protein